MIDGTGIGYDTSIAMMVMGSMRIKKVRGHTEVVLIVDISERVRVVKCFAEGCGKEIRKNKHT